MNLENLKKLGEAEKRLSKMRVDQRKEELMEFADDPEVAKVIDYMNRYHSDIPEGHPVFKYIESIKNTKGNKEFAKAAIREKHLKDQEAEESSKKRIQIKKELNSKLELLEKECDKVFEFLEANKTCLSGETSGVSYVLKLRRFLCALKGGLKTVRAK